MVTQATVPAVAHVASAVPAAAATIQEVEHFRYSGAPSDGHEVHPALSLGGRRTMVFFWVVQATPTSSSTQTLTGPVVQTHAALRQAMRCSWGTT
jgi:hypothetical protein